MYPLLFMQKQRARRLRISVTLENMERVTILMSLWRGCRWSPRVTTWLGITVTGTRTGKNIMLINDVLQTASQAYISRTWNSYQLCALRLELSTLCERELQYFWNKKKSVQSLLKNRNTIR